MTHAIEVNFDGLVGPTHNYAGLSLGNVASSTNAGATARPRDAALQGLQKMRRLMELGLPQGFLPPHPRPNLRALRSLGFSGTADEIGVAAWAADPQLFKNMCSASAMWTANAATVSPAADTRDGRVHLTVANLTTMPHRATEPDETFRQLSLIFRNERHFAVHPALPGQASFGDEGAANHMRIASSHGAPGLEVFVYGAPQRTGFPARQTRRAAQAVSRLNHLPTERVEYAQQADHAIQAGVFHNDVVAVANEHVLFTHGEAFADPDGLYARIRQAVPQAEIIEVPASEVTLADAVQTYLFNSQLITHPDGSGMTLVLPAEVRSNPRVWTYLQKLMKRNTAIRRFEVIDVKESMRNGGGPACLRLRVQVSEEALAAIDQRFMLDHKKWAELHSIVENFWPERVTPSDLGTPELWHIARRALAALYDAMGLAADERPSLD